MGKIRENQPYILYIVKKWPSHNFKEIFVGLFGLNFIVECPFKQNSMGIQDIYIIIFVNELLLDKPFEKYKVCFL